MEIFLRIFSHLITELKKECWHVNLRYFNKFYNMLTGLFPVLVSCFTEDNRLFWSPPFGGASNKVLHFGANKQLNLLRLSKTWSLIPFLITTGSYPFSDHILHKTEINWKKLRFRLTFMRPRQIVIAPWYCIVECMNK